MAPELLVSFYNDHLHDKILFAKTYNSGSWKFFFGLFDEKKEEKSNCLGSNVFRNLSKNNEK